MTTLKTIFYMGIMHGLFTFYLPYQISSYSRRFFDFGPLDFLSIPLWILGTFIIINCSWDMVRRGQGTPAHLDPPKQLIVTGMYRYVRNPIYLGALLTQFGYIVWFGSGLLIIYFLFFLLAFQILIVFIEEPILKNMFDGSYDEYCSNVSRWIPRLN